MGKLQLIGLMSGTSLDGLDVAHVEFDLENHGEHTFNLGETKTFAYPTELQERLANAHTFSLVQILQLDKVLGRFFADCVNTFIAENRIDKRSIAAIASHGQTILHQPANGFTYQIGCGSTLAHFTGVDVVNDFRTRDIVAGGQGAPLVPIGDFGLFGQQAEAFLNIGGICNFSFRKAGVILAYDLCPGNLPLNKLAMTRGMHYDKQGKLAASGEINFFLLDLLNSLDYYQQKGPKSLGTEWLEDCFYPLLRFDKEVENNLHTVVEHEAIQIGLALNELGAKSLLITGGGAKNDFLIARIKHYFNGEVLIPDVQIVDFKEAIVFAYLGALYLKGIPNCLSSVTGATQNVLGGVLHKA